METFKWKTPFAETTFRNKYAFGPEDTWPNLSRRLVSDVCGDRTACGKPAEMPLMSTTDQAELTNMIINQKFIAGGRYLYYAGRPASFYNNCFCLRAEEDTREEWGNVVKKASDCLMSGGGIGVDYSILRPSGRTLRRTGGISSGPIPLMCSVNEVGRNVMQGGSRRSAIYASLNWQHDDIEAFLRAKNWTDDVKAMKAKDFNFPAPLDMTNTSINWDTAFYESSRTGKNSPPTSTPHDLWYRSVRQMCETGEPGHSYNFYHNEKDTLRNAPLGPDTNVLTRDGYQLIRDIVDEQVEVWTGFQWATTTFKKTGDMVPVMRVMMSGGREIIAEPSHEFILEHGMRVAAVDLLKNDRLALSGVKVTAPTYRDEEYYTLGFIYGDGSFHRKYPRAEVTICAEDKMPCFGRMAANLMVSAVHGDKGYLRVYFRNSDLFAGRNKASLPDEMFSLPLEKQVAFLAGLFDADGNYGETRGTIRLASMHREFLNGVRRLLEQLGIYSGISTAGLSSYSNKQGYMLTVYTEYHDLFARIIPTERLLLVVPYTPKRKTKIRVVSVEPAGFSDVFCCDVGVPEHSFVAEGVLVSNCTEFTSEDDSDVCNLGSVNMGNIETIEEFEEVVSLAAKFLICGSIRGDLPYEKVAKVREQNRKIGLGLMGIHEWLLKRGYSYEMNNELEKWLHVYKSASEKAANEHCDRFYLNHPKKYRAIAPAGTIGILASTTTGIEPLFAVSYKRRYLTQGTRWKYQYVIDATAQRLIDQYGLDPESIETSSSLSSTPEKRIQFQYDVQRFVDMSISSTINLPAWGTERNNEDTAKDLAGLLLKYCHGLRGMTVYPDGGRGAQPLTVVPYDEAKRHVGVIFDENDERCAGGICGL